MTAILLASLALAFSNDRTNLIYSCGETATFTVTASDTAGAKLEGRVRATLDDFGHDRFAEVVWDLSETNVFTISGSMSKPGFLRLHTEREDGKLIRDWGVGYDPWKIVKGSPMPDDFDEYWTAARRRLAAEVPLDPQMKRIDGLSTSNYDFYEISFATFGRRVYGFMSVPTDKSKSPYPVDFGVNAAGFGDWTNNLHPRKDSICVQFSVYPFPMDRKWKENGLQARYDAMVKEWTDRYGCSGGYASAGIGVSREEYFFYPVLLGIDRAVDWLAARDDVDLGRFRYQGTSQGGGFGFYLCGLNRHFTRAALFVPAITDTMGFLAGRVSGWPKVTENNNAVKERHETAIRWAPYFDGANFASRIRCPVRVVVGFSDVTCPPCAVYAAYNEIPVKDKAILHGFGMTHSCSGEFYSRLDRWIRSDGKAGE